MEKAAPISADDRLALEEVCGRYAFALDTGDVAGVVALFTDDGRVIYADGRRFEGAAGLRDFARSAIGGADALGRMHVVRPLFAERRGEDIMLRSYLIVPQAVDGGDPVLVTLRYVEDLFRRTANGWRIGERTIAPWPTEWTDMRDAV